MDKPLVSIIVPSFNQGKFIRKTLDSILAQDYRPLEVIVIDGASTDETVSVLHAYDAVPEVQWISEPDSGVVEAVNKGFARARGEIGAIQSSDDYYLPGAISAGVAALQSSPSAGFAFGDIAKVDVDGRELMRTALKPYSLENVLALSTWIPQPSTFFRLALARELGGWREQVPYAADTDLWFRMAFRASAVKIDRLMAGRTMHEAQRDRHGDRIVRDYGLMLDQLAPLAKAPKGVRQSANAGRLRILNRYQPATGYWSGFFRSWRLVLACPRLISEIEAWTLIPGAGPLRRLLSHAKQRLLRGA